MPDRYCAALEHPPAGARQALLDHMRETRHTMAYYCLDYWADYTGLQIIPLHHELAHLIQYRPGARKFLDWLDNRGMRRMLVTNAHRDSLSVKDAYSGLQRTMHTTVSSHDYGHPKESAAFWGCLAEHHPFDPGRALLIDDSQAVLEAAAAFGIAKLLTVCRPDSARPARDDLKFPAFDDFAELMRSR